MWESSEVPQYAVKTLSILAGSTSSRAEMSCGTPLTGKWGWMIVSCTPKGQWLWGPVSPSAQKHKLIRSLLLPQKLMSILR